MRANRHGATVRGIEQYGFADPAPAQGQNQNQPTLGDLARNLRTIGACVHCGQAQGTNRYCAACQIAGKDGR